MQAMYAYQKVILGLNMLPLNISKAYHEFASETRELTIEEQETLIRQGCIQVPLAKEEIEALLVFCADKHGVPYDHTNMGNLGPKELHECMVAVCMEMVKIDISLVSKDEKKKFHTSRLNSELTSLNTPH